MEIVTYEDIKDSDMTELMLTCFNHTYTKEHVEEMIKTDPRLPKWGGELYAKEGSKVLGTVGLLFPRIKIKGGIEKVGGIRNVCSRPSVSRKGIATKLLEEAHKRMKREGVRYSFLMTEKSMVAYGLYRKLGYRDIHVYPSAYRKKKKRDYTSKEIEFKEERDSDYIYWLYKKSVEGLTGLIIREDNFLDIAETRGWPNSENIRTAYRDGERVGYILYKGGRNHIVCNEIGVEQIEDLPILIDAVENKVEKDYFVLNFVNPNYKGILKRSGFNYYDDRWGRIMVKDFENGSDKSLAKLGYKESFHNGIYESY